MSFILTLCLLAAFSFQAPASALPANPDLPDGYLPSTQGEELAEVPTDVILVPKPSPLKPPLTSEDIFDQKLTHEFTERYRESFGYTEAERNVGLPLLYAENGVAQGRSLQDDQAREARRKFAEYMLRRLGEYHMDLYFRSEPSLKKAWEFKERISNVEVKMAGGVSLMTIYSFSGNYVTLDIRNPYVGSNVRLQFNPAGFGPSSVQEAVLSLSKNVTRTLRMETHYKVYDGIIDLIGMKTITPRMSVTASASADLLAAGTVPQQNIYLAGFNYTY